MLKVILHGCNGRMGKVLQQMIAASDNICVAAGIDRDIEVVTECDSFNKNNLNNTNSKKFPIYMDLRDCTEAADVVIDFSNHAAVTNLLNACVDKNLPVVIATTALEENELSLLKEAALSIPVFHSFNMSLGINLIAKLMNTVMSVLEDDFNVEIVEKHHNKKKDSPSGTALLLADAVNDACKVKKEYIYGRNGKDDECKLTELGIHAVRGGSIPGEHTLIFAGEDEIIEITHTALSRNIFAKGALKAAQYVAGKENGLYSMREMI